MTRTPRIYVSGSMRGHADGQTPLFNETSKRLSDAGYLVFNPASNPDDLPLHEYLRIDLDAVIDSDAVCVIGNWDNSDGARLEVQLARALGKPVHRIEEFEAHGFDLNATSTAVLPVEIQAASLTRNGQRQQEYGHPSSDFNRTAGMWSAYLGHDVTGADVALMMAMVKISRLRATPGHKDSIVDLLGYGICLSRLDEPQ